MNAAAHTPGQWYASGDEVLIDMGDRSHLVATVANWSEDTEAYARLIAAAPDLLAALIELRKVELEDAADASGILSLRAKADAAIAKAKGEAQ